MIPPTSHRYLNQIATPMKTILVSALAAISMIATGVAGPIPLGTKVKLELVSIIKTDNNKLNPRMKIFAGAPSTLQIGKVYEFAMGAKGKLVGPSGVEIPYATDSIFTKLQLSYLKIPGVTNFYVDKKLSGKFNTSVFVEFGAAYQKNNKGKPIAITLTYLNTVALPKFSTQSINFVFESPSN